MYVIFARHALLSQTGGAGPELHARVTGAEGPLGGRLPAAQHRAQALGGTWEGQGLVTTGQALFTCRNLAPAKQ
jgi:hypothetical protein